MTPRAFSKICESFKFPKAIFRYQVDWLNERCGLVIEINDVTDIFTGQQGPLHNGIEMTERQIEFMDERGAKEFIRKHLMDTLIHEMDENLEVAGDRPWYPHGPWKERAHLMRPRMQYVPLYPKMYDEMSSMAMTALSAESIRAAVAQLKNFEATEEFNASVSDSERSAEPEIPEKSA